MVIMETRVAELFHDYINNDLVALGWTVEQVLPHAYTLTDVTGQTVLVSCHIEQYLNYDRYSVFIKMGDDLAPVGTVAKVDGEWQIFKLD